MSQTILITMLSFSFLYTVLEWTKRRINVSSNITRKVAHVGSAILVIFFYFFLSKNEFILTTSFFAIVFIVSYATKFLKSIHLENHKTVGEILYPISLIILGFFFYDNRFIMISSVAVMGFADAISGLYNIKYNKDTLRGSLIFFLVTLIVIFVSYLNFYNQLLIFTLIKIIFISIFVSIIEYHSHNGTDNLTVPISTALLLNFFL
jgi:phytol kinase